MNDRRTAVLLFSLMLSLASVPCVAKAAATHKASGHAPVQWYTVDILVFRYTGKDIGGGETWPEHVLKPSTAHAIYPPSVSAGAYATQTHLPAIITQSLRKLKNANGYSPILTMGWQQPANQSGNGRAVSVTPIFAMSPTTQTLPSPETTSSSPMGLTGTVKLLVSNHVPAIALDLRLCESPPSGVIVQAPPSSTITNRARAPDAASQYQPQEQQSMPTQAEGNSAIPSFGQSEPKSLCFLLHQKSAVKFGRLQYFDNPIFGVLALVNKFKAPTK